MTTVVITVGAWRNYFAARQWQEIPCTVEFSRVQSHDSDDGTTYSVDILYRYEIDDQTSRSNRYTFTGGSSSGVSVEPSASVGRSSPFHLRLRTRSSCANAPVTWRRHLDAHPPSNACAERYWDGVIIGGF